MIRSIRDIRGALLALAALLFVSAVPHAALAAGAQIHIYFEGERLRFEGAQPAAVDGRTLVPFPIVD